MSELAENLQIDRKSFDARNGESIVALLQQVQEQYNYLPEHVLRDLARARGLSLMEIFSVATFYKSFSLQPRGKHKFVVCTGTACHVQGSEKVTDELSRMLGIKPGETSQDGEYSLENVNCLGACALAPLLVVDGNYHGNMTVARVAAIIKEQLRKDKGKTAEALNQEIEQKARDGCCCARLLAGENK
jgi:NADH-quinone oxidoreductase subunit E